jgi:spore germination protein GerM
MIRSRTILAVATALWAISSCAIQTDSAPRDVPSGERALGDPVDPEAGASEGSRRVFLLTSDEDSGERMLRSRSRQVDSTPDAVLEELFKGPNESELEAGLGTELPEELSLNSPSRRIAGILTVDLSPEILELGLSQLRLAVAQIVFTASELEGVRAVRLRVDGENRDWPDGRGELESDALSTYDYPGLVESTQPPFPAAPSAQAP